MGISVARVRIVTFALGGTLVGMAGAMQAHYVLVISPHDLGFFVSLNYIIFLLFGGMYTLWGPILGAVILTVAPEALRFANEYRMILYGLIIVAVVLWRPEGLVKRRPTGTGGGFFGHWPGNAAPEHGRGEPVAGEGALAPQTQS